MFKQGQPEKVTQKGAQNKASFCSSLLSQNPTD
jgi:hypothetical protein